MHAAAALPSGCNSRLCRPDGRGCMHLARSACWIQFAYFRTALRYPPPPGAIMPAGHNGESIKETCGPRGCYASCKQGLGSKRSCKRPGGVSSATLHADFINQSRKTTPVKAFNTIRPRKHLSENDGTSSTRSTPPSLGIPGSLESARSKFYPAGNP